MSSTMKVRASVLHGARDLRVEQRELPPPSEGEVQVSVRATGLCGSDLHYHGHYRNGDIAVREPLTLGHESAGVVAAVGAGVAPETLRVGDRVALEVGLPCDACDLCRQGRYNICRAMSFRSSAKAFPHAQGTLQDRINHPARWCHKLPPNVSLSHGALVEPLAVALHGRRRASLAPGSTVLVLGAGAVGLLCAFASRAAGARAVVVADIQADRVRFAVDHGFADAGVTVPLSSARRPGAETIEEKLAYARGLAETVKAAEVPGPEGDGDGDGDGVGAGEKRGKKKKKKKVPVGEVSATFECTGVESCMQTAIYPGGKVMIIGMGNPVQTLPISAASLREVDLVGVFRYANAYPEVIQLLAAEDKSLPDVGKLITQRFRGLDSIPAAFDTAARVRDEKGDLVLKVMVELSE